MSRAEPATKRCHECGKRKRIRYYDRNKDGADGRRNVCKRCRAEWSAAYNQRENGRRLLAWGRATPQIDTDNN